MNEICIINDNLLFVIVFMHEICRINMHVMHFCGFEKEGIKRIFEIFCIFLA